MSTAAHRQTTKDMVAGGGLSREKAVKYWLLAQTQASLFSKDTSTKVGAILLKPGSLQILSLGYNGMPRGIDESRPERWERPIKYKYVEHAERNAIYNASRHGTPLADSIAVITLFPCCDCARALIQSGIHTVVTVAPEREGADLSMSLFTEAGVEVVILSEDELQPSFSDLLWQTAKA